MTLCLPLVMLFRFHLSVCVTGNCRIYVSFLVRFEAPILTSGIGVQYLGASASGRMSVSSCYTTFDKSKQFPLLVYTDFVQRDRPF